MYLPKLLSSRRGDQQGYLSILLNVRRDSLKIVSMASCQIVINRTIGDNPLEQHPHTLTLLTFYYRAVFLHLVGSNGRRTRNDGVPITTL